MIVSPLRFVAFVLAAWTGGRLAVTLLWSEAPAPVADGTPIRVATNAARAPDAAPMPAAASTSLGISGEQPLPASARRPAAVPQVRQAGVTRIAAPDAVLLAGTEPADASAPAAPAPLPAPPPPGPVVRRWHGDAYLFLRNGDGPGLAPGAQLGGGQAFARLSYALDHGIDATARASRALRGKGAEAALGLRWSLPGRAAGITIERRIALDRAGRDAWSAFVAGGVDGRRVGPLRLSAYAQAGVVGARRRDGFADGAARIGLPAGPATLGAGLWGAAQPGVARVDIGPQATVRIAPGVSAALDWRVRVAGDARPGTGIAFTLATGF